MQTYMPWVARQAISKIIGPGRVKSLKSGGEVFDVQAIVGVKWELLGQVVRTTYHSTILGEGLSFVAMEVLL